MKVEPIRVLMVCLGNICRSPMAEGVMNHQLDALGLTGHFDVDSAGTAGYHAGELADRRTLAVLDREGAPRPGVSRRVTEDDFMSFDWILAMDRANLNALRGRAPKTGGRAHLALILEPTGGGEVPDPYYGEGDGFEHVYQLLEGSIRVWIERWSADR